MTLRIFFLLLAGLLSAILIFACIGQLLYNRWSRDRKTPRHPFIDLDAKCPACGHYGCELEFVPPGQVIADDGKGSTRTDEARVRRKCKTCGASAYEKTVLPPEKWIGK